MKALLLLGITLATTVALPAQPLSFGEPFALTNTRYAERPAQPTLRSNGRELLLFWPTATNVRVTKLAEGQRRGGRNALEYGLNFSVAWNGTHFLIVAQTPNGVFGRLLRANGDPLSDAFRIVEEGQLPKVASNGASFLMLYTIDGVLHSRPLDALGHPSAAATKIATRVEGGTPAYDVASNGDGFLALVSDRLELSSIAFDAHGRATASAVIYGTSEDGYIALPSIASNGSDYLAVWATRGGTLAAGVTTDGAHTPPLLVAAESTSSSFSVVWTGTHWTVAHTSSVPGENRRVRITHIDQPVLRIIGREETIGSDPSLAVANGRVVAAWRPTLLGDPAVTSPLPLGSREPEPATFAATDQSLGATASSHDATLVTWTEYSAGRTRVYVGVRDRNGDWSEREIADTLSSAVRLSGAASDGRGFVVLLATGARSEALFLDARGRSLGSNVPLPLTPVGVAWNGSHYVIIGSGANQVEAVTLTPSGIVSSPAVIAAYGVPKAIATNGTTTVAAWLEVESCPILCPFIFGRLQVVRLGNDLRPIDPSSLVASPVIEEATLTWDGTRFLAAWLHEDELIVTRVPASGGEANIIAGVAAPYARELTATRVAAGAAFAWRETVDRSGAAVNRLAILQHDNGIETVTVSAEPHAGKAHAVASTADGGVLYVDVRPQYAAPHHGSRRIVARVAPARELPPDAPVLRAESANGRIHLTWSRPPQRVSGYRIEYRISDGSWHELDAWLDAGQRSHVVPWTVARGVPVLFRIRAFNDAGASEYSAVSGVNLPRRRSVR